MLQNWWHVVAPSRVRQEKRADRHVARGIGVAELSLCATYVRLSECRLGRALPPSPQLHNRLIQHTPSVMSECDTGCTGRRH